MSLNLDLSNVTDNGSSLPDGSYGVSIVKAELAATKAGGKMIKIQFKVTEGEHAGRVVFDQLNIENANPVAANIGLAQLKNLLKAAKVANPNHLGSVDELLGLRCSIKVKTEESQEWGAQTRVKSYSALATNSTGSNPFV